MMLSSLLGLALVSGLKCHPVGSHAEDGVSACERLTQLSRDYEEKAELPRDCNCDRRTYTEDEELSLAMDALLCSVDVERRSSLFDCMFHLRVSRNVFNLYCFCTVQ